jgi:hypothetical protein
MTAGKDYGVEVVVAYENKRVGDVIFPPGVLRQRLVMSGLVRSKAPEPERPAKSVNHSKPPLKLR